MADPSDASETARPDYPLAAVLGWTIGLNALSVLTDKLGVPVVPVVLRGLLVVVGVAGVVLSVRLVRRRVSRLAWCGVVGWSVATTLYGVNYFVSPLRGPVLGTLAVVSTLLYVASTFTAVQPKAAAGSSGDDVDPSPNLR